MLREIEEKKRLLDSKRPFNAMTAEKFVKLDLFDFVFSNLKLDGSNLTPEGVNAILNGGLVPGVSLLEHSAVECHRNLIKRFDEMKHMRTSINVKELISIYSVLADIPYPSFRRGNPILYQLNYTPPYYQDIEPLLIELFRNLFTFDYGNDFIRMAVDIHDNIIRIYPFDEFTESLARTILQYAIYSNGYPLIQFGVSEQVYNDMVGDSLKRDTHEAMYNCVQDALNHKLDALLNYLDY